MKKILVVDDQPCTRELVAMTLSLGPYQILEADSGPKALELAQREKPDLILLDVIMPQTEMDGFEVCRQLKADEATRRCHVVILTGQNEEQDIEVGYGAGADDYVIKPFSPLELITKVNSVIGGDRA
jgi:CheY-like chemotaxis protein